MADAGLIILLVIVIGATAQVTPKLCGEATKKGEEEEMSARSFTRLGFLRPGGLFRGNPSSADPAGPPDMRPGDSGLLHGSGTQGSPNGGYGIIHGGSDNQILSKNRIFGQGVGLKNNSLSQKIGNLLNHQSFGILSGNSLNVNRTHQNNSGPNYQVFLPGVFHHNNPVGGHGTGGGAHGGSGGGLLNHIHRPHPHLGGGGSTHQGGHLSGLLGGHHHSHSHNSVHPIILHLHHGSHGHGGHGGGGLAGVRPGHHLTSGGPPGANHLLGGGGGLHHGKPGGLIHGGVGVVGPATGMLLGHRPHPHGTLGLVHGILGNQGVSGSTGVGAGLPVSAEQSQQHHGGLLGLLQSSLGNQGLFAGGVGGSNHITGGSSVSSGSTLGHHGLIGLIQGVHGGVQGGGLQTVTSSELKPGHVYLHLGQLGGQTSGTSGSSLQPIGGSSGQVYGNGGGLVFTQTGQGVHGGQVINTINTHQTGATGGSQIGQFQSQHNLHQGALSQSGASGQQQVVASNAGGYHQGVLSQGGGSAQQLVVTSNAGGYHEGALSQGGTSAQQQVFASNSGGYHQGALSQGGTSAQQQVVASNSGGYHQGALSQGGTSAQQQVVSTNAGGYFVSPGQQQYQGYIYETQWSQPPPASTATPGSSLPVGAVGIGSTNLNSLSQVSQGSNSYAGGSNAQSSYGSQNVYEGNNLHGSSQLLANEINYNYNSGQTVQPVGNAGVYGISSGSQVQVVPISQSLQQGNIAGGTSTQHSHQSSSSSSFNANSSSQNQESTSQQSYFSGSLVGSNTGGSGSSTGLEQSSGVNYVDSNQVTQQSQLYGNSQAQSAGTTGGQYNGNYGFASTSTSYPTQQSNQYLNHQTQGHYPQGSVILVLQQAPLADEEIFTSGNEATLSGSSIGSGNTDNIYSNTNSFSTGSTSSVGGGSGSISSTSQNLLGSSSVTSGNEMKYSGTSAAAIQHSGGQSSTSTHSLSTSENVKPTSTASHSLNVSPSTTGSGYHASSGSSYNSQYNQPNVGSGNTQSVVTTSQYHGSGNISPHGSSLEQGNTVLSTGIGGTSDNQFSTVNKGSSAGVGMTSASSTNSWHSEGNGVSTGSSYGTETNGPAISSQTLGVGQFGSTGSVSTSSDLTSTTNHRVNYTHGASSVPTKITSTSMLSNQENSNGVGQQTQSFSSSVGTSGEQTSTSFNEESQAAMFSAQYNSHGQYGFQGIRDKPSTMTSSTNYASSGVKEQEYFGPSLMSSQRPPNKAGQQSSTLTTNTGTAHHNQILASSSASSIEGGSGTTNTHLGTYYPTYENNAMLSSNTASTESNTSYQTASGSSGQLSSSTSSVGSAQQFHTSGSPSYSSGSSVGGGGAHSSTHGNNASPSTTSASGSQTQPLTVSGNSEQTYGSNLHGGSGLSSVFGGEYEPASVDNKNKFGTNYNTHISSQQGVDNTYPGSQGVSFISSNTPSTTIGPSEVDSTHLAVSNVQMYGVSSTSGHHVSSSGYGNQVAISGAPTNDNNSALSSENLQISGVSGTTTAGSQSVTNTSPEIPVQFTSQSSGVASQTNSEVNKELNSDHLGSGSTGQISNQYLNSNQFGIMTATHGESGSGNQVLGSSGLDGNTYSQSSSYQSGSAIRDNQPAGLISPSYGGTSYAVSSSNTSPHQAPAGYTQGGTTQVIGSNTNGYNSMLNAQGYTSGGLTAGGGINKEFTGSVQTTSFRYPGQYSFKYGYVPPKVYANIEYPGSSNYEPSHIVYNGDVNPDTGLSGYYYHYSTVGSPLKERIVEKYPVQTVVEELSTEPDVLVNSVQNGRPPLLIDVDKEDEAEEDQNKNVVKGSVQGHFEHSGGGSFEGSVSRPFSGGLSFTGNHELSSGISGGVSGHLGNVGNFQGFLGNAANRVGGIISGVGHAVGIIRDGEVSVSTGGSGFEAHVAPSVNPDSRTPSQQQQQPSPAPVVEIQEEFQQQNPYSN